MLRLGLSEVGVTEVVAVAEHVYALGRTAQALLLGAGADLEDEPRCLLAPVDPSEVDPAVAATLAEIAEHERGEIGRDLVPVHWRIVARDRHYLEATWRKHLTVLGDGEVPVDEKRLVALGAAAAAGSPYVVERAAAAVRHAGRSDDDLLEVLAVADHYASFNTVTDAMDLRP